MENVATHEDWKVCFSELAPGLVLFARQWVRSAPDAEDVVQEALVRFWRRNLSIKNRALLYAAVRSAALDLIRRDNRRARREVEVFGDAERTVQPSAELTSRVGSVLANSEEGTAKVIRPEQFRINWLGLGLGLAAAATFLIFARVDFHPNERTKQTIASATPSLRQKAAALPNYQATGLTQVVYSKRDEGLVFPAGAEGPSRRVRRA